MVGTVATTVSYVVELGRPEVAAACCFAAMVGGNMDDVRDITCKMIDQVSELLHVAHTYLQTPEMVVDVINVATMVDQMIQPNLFLTYTLRYVHWWQQSYCQEGHRDH